MKKKYLKHDQIFYQNLAEKLKSIRKNVVYATQKDLDAVRKRIMKMAGFNRTMDRLEKLQEKHDIELKTLKREMIVLRKIVQDYRNKDIQYKKWKNKKNRKMSW